MGALFDNRCYPDNSSAADAYFLSVGPHFTAGSTSYLQEYLKVGGVWKIQRYSVASNGTVTTLTQSNAPTPAFPACDPTESFFDGMTLGWGVAGAIVAAWVIKNMRRGL